jgi:general L-amino acid transport system permease protein
MQDKNARGNVGYIRHDLVPESAPPSTGIRPIVWLRRNLFRNVTDTILTVVALNLIWLAVPPLFHWAVGEAQWDGVDREACLPHQAGACWAYVKANLGQFAFGRYPPDQRWRVTMTFFFLVVGLVPLGIPRIPFKRLNLLYLAIVFPLFSAGLLIGGSDPLPEVETALWGGLMLSIVVSYVGMVTSLPLGILLALGRQSNFPALRVLCVIFIEFWRGVPLITVLFMASVMLPLFLPPGVSFDKLLRALIGISLFASAYMAEVIRGGLEGVPKSQYEGARALGLGYWRMMRFVVLPQALKIVIPGIANTYIGLFKDTSLVYTIGLFEFLGIVRQSFSDPSWTTFQTPATGLVFAALVFWIICFSISQYARYIERRLRTAYRK